MVSNRNCHKTRAVIIVAAVRYSTSPSSGIAEHKDYNAAGRHAYSGQDDGNTISGKHAIP